MVKTLRTLLLAAFLTAGPAVVTVVATPSVAAADAGGSWWSRVRRAWRARVAARSTAVPEMSVDAAGSAGALLIGGALLIASGRRRRDEDLA